MASQAADAPKKITKFTVARAVLHWRKWWREDVLGTVDQYAVIKKRRDECVLSGRYLFMTAMSGGIAILGLLLSSPAVVIGAMLLSPLMDPIMGLGFALAIGDYRWLKQSAISLAWGTLIAVGLCSLVVFFSPLQDITSEIAARTRPNLFDLMVALFSALAGAYAMIRGREGTIVGVAIATALMPPLAVIGFGLATFNWDVFSGALLLYITNLVTIALTAALMARLYGFRTRLSDKQTKMQNFIIVGAFIALAVPLALSLRQIAWEASASVQARNQLADQFGASAQLSQPEIDFGDDQMTVRATVWTTRLEPDAETLAENKLSEALGEPVDIVLRQFLVSDQKSAEAAKQAAAKAAESEAIGREQQSLRERLALAAGTPAEAVLVDAQARRAYVRAAELEDASLATYRALEKRIAAASPGWTVEMQPQSAALPQIGYEDDALTARGKDAVSLIIWAAQRLDESEVVLTGGTQAARQEAQTLLAEDGIIAQLESGGPTMTARWAEPLLPEQ